MASFLHSGDLGDAIYALPSVRGLGGGDVYFASRPWTRTRWEDGKLLELIKPLFEEAGYGAHLHSGEYIDHDFSTFRHGGYLLGDTIVARQARWLRAEISLEPWLKAKPKLSRPLIINRADRWAGFHFPWKEIRDAFAGAILFIGLPKEHWFFEKEFGPVAFYEPRNLLEAAQIICGAELFIGNQSCCLAIANGLGKPVLVEVCPYAPDCFLKRPNAFFSFSGEVEIDAAGHKLSLAPFAGTYKTKIGERVFSSDDRDKLRVIARGYHAYVGSFAFFEEVPIYA
jgi:hypothetical protein